MVTQLHGVLLTRPDAPPVPAAKAASNGLGSDATVAEGGHPDDALVALPEGRRYHRRDCAMVADKRAAAVVSGAAIRRRGLEPCDLCEPAPTGTAPAAAATSR
jgi:hypothetical protein